MLVVDDDDESRQVMAAPLESLQATVFMAASAAEALELMQREHVDVLLADVAHLQDRPRDERGLLSRALELYTRLGSVEAVNVRARLAGGRTDVSG